MSFHLCKICTVCELMLSNNVLIVSNAESYYGFIGKLLKMMTLFD